MVAILCQPFYGLVEYKLELVTKVYFNQRDFSQTQVLQDSFHNINRQLNPSIIDSPELLTGFSVRALFNRFGSQVIVLFKLLMLEKKTIFISSPIRGLSSSILTLCSLIPGLIQVGLEHSSIPFNVKSKGENLLFNLSKSKEKLNIVSNDNTTTVSTIATFNDESTQPHCDIVSETVTSLINSMDLNFTPTSLTIVDNVSSQNLQSQPEVIDKSQCNLSSLEQDDFFSPPEENEEETKKRFDTIINRHYSFYGLPLQLFTCSSYLLPYFSMPYFDVLIHERIRSCVAGSSNQIFKRWENDIDVFVDVCDFLEYYKILLY